MILGIGTDLVSVERIARIIARSPRFVQRVFHPQEQNDANGRADRLAVRYAAKEAWLKAMGLPLFSVALPDVFVEIKATGQPILCLAGKAAELAEEHGMEFCHLSLTHEKSYALAVVVLEGVRK